MGCLVWILTVFVSLHMANSYILLTANLEDVQAIAKQLAASPVVDQLSKIWRRATNQFNQQVVRARPQQRAAFQPRAREEDPAKPAQAPQKNQENVEDLSDVNEAQVARRHQRDDDIVALGKNASIYLKSIRKIFENA